MGYNGKGKRWVYTIGGYSVGVQNDPVISDRVPTSSDVCEIGDIWINKSSDAAYIMTSVSSGEATWTTSAFSAAATCTELTIDPGSLVMTGGGDISCAGTLTLSGAALTHSITSPLALADSLTIGSSLTIATTLDVTGATSVTDLAVTGDFDMTSAALIDLTSTLDADPAIYLHANGGTSETLTLRSSQGTSVTAVNLTAAVGGITLTTGLASDDSFNIASTGGVDIDAAMQINIATSETDADSFSLISAGGMDITVAGGAGKDIDLTCTSGSFNVDAGEDSVSSIILEASGAAASMELKAGSAGILIGNEVDTALLDLGNVAPTASRIITIGGGQVATAAVSDTIDIGVDGATTEATASKIVNIASGALDTSTQTVNIASGAVASGTQAVNIGTGTGTKTFNLGNADGLTSVNIDGITLINDSVDVATSINSGTSTGAVAIGNALAGAFTVDTAAGISLDSITASNFTVTGAADLTLSSSAGSAILTSGEAAVNAISIQASDAAGGIDIDSGTNGISVDTTGSFSLDGAAASNITLTGAFDLTTNSTLGSLIYSAGEAVADAIQLTASDAAGGLLLTSGTGGITSVNTGKLSLASTLASDITVTGADLTLESVGASVILQSDEAVVNAVDIIASAGGFSLNGILGSNIVVTGASADLSLKSVGGSVLVDGSEAAVDAVTIISSVVGGGIDIDANTGGLTVDSAGVMSFDSVDDSNITVTGAGKDLTVNSVGGSVLVSSDEAAATAVRIVASDVAGGISIEGDGLTTMERNSQNIASPAVIATSNYNHCSFLCTGFTTAAAASETFTITNSLAVVDSSFLSGCTNAGANNAQMTITRILPQAGSFIVTVKNNGAAALNGNIRLSFWINNS